MKTSRNIVLIGLGNGHCIVGHGGYVGSYGSTTTTIQERTGHKKRLRSQCLNSWSHPLVSLKHPTCFLILWAGWLHIEPNSSWVTNLLSHMHNLQRSGCRADKSWSRQALLTEFKQRYVQSSWKHKLMWTWKKKSEQISWQIRSTNNCVSVETKRRAKLSSRAVTVAVQCGFTCSRLYVPGRKAVKTIIRVKHSRT